MQLPFLTKKSLICKKKRGGGYSWEEGTGQCRREVLVINCSLRERFRRYSVSCILH